LILTQHDIDAKQVKHEHHTSDISAEGYKQIITTGLCPHRKADLFDHFVKRYQTQQSQPQCGFISCNGDNNGIPPRAGAEASSTDM
jgi:hypothetical protein